jgi:hypothetical protein
MLDANAPWVTGAEVAVRARQGAVDDAAYLLARYQDAALQYPPMAEFSAAPGARYGPGESHDGGRLWDNAAWFDAVYGTHYGLRMTPRALLVQPTPLRQIGSDSADGLSYQGMRFRITLNPEGYTLTVLSGTSRAVVFYPSGRYQRLSVNGNPQQPSQTIQVRPGEVFTIINYGPPPGQ